MAKSKQSFEKREKEKQRQKDRLDKQAKMEERKASQGKGKSLEDMMAYIDENGNLTSTPPDPEKKKVFNAEDIEIGVTRSQETEEMQSEGRVEFFNQSKGFGFIQPNRGEKIFFHVSQLTEPVNEGDFVTYTIENGPKGFNAAGVAKKK